MCGIVACRTHAQAPVIDYLLTALRRLEYRGYDSVGAAVRTADGEIARFRTIDRIGALDQVVRAWPGAALDGVGIGHTRWATHGLVSEQNAHPHTDCGGRISLVHNGIIENSDQLRMDLTVAGHRFSSDVDSEVLCHLIEDQLNTCEDLFDAVENALASLEGTWALAVLERGTGRLVVAANRSPLLVARTVDHGYFATSDIAAISDWTQEFRVLEDGDVVELDNGGRWRNRGKNAAPKALARCAWQASDARLNGYADFMAKEIDEQPEAVARILDSFGDGIANGSLWASLDLMPFDRLSIVGCGSSLHAGQVIGRFVRRIGGMPVTMSVASESSDDIVEPHTLRLAISQSGETADVLNAVAAKGLNDPMLLALTNNAHSSLARRANAVMRCQAGPEIGVAATKTFVCQIVAGVAVMTSALVSGRWLSAAAAARMVDDLRRLPDRLAAANTIAKCVVPQIAEQLMEANGIVFIGRGSGIPYAAEGALKLKELAYLWTEHCPAGELKHGPLALITQGVPVVVVDNCDPKLAANIAEVRTRGGNIITVGPTGSTVPVVSTPLGEWGPLESAVALQILARTMALALDRDVDKPRNLAKSVTVE
jgi:glucosamine--fructose-6-phosphate aminotransferase (isomerizing)